VCTFVLRPILKSPFLKKTIFLSWLESPSGPRPPHCWGLRSHSDTAHSAGLFWTSDWPSQRPLPDNTKHSKERGIHGPCWVRTRNLSNWAALKDTMAAEGLQRPLLLSNPSHISVHQNAQWVTSVITLISLHGCALNKVRLNEIYANNTSRKELRKVVCKR
jgi:hypothetical protein